MTTYYVSVTNGDNGQDGQTPATARRTLNAAMALANSSADVVEIIDQGTYTIDANTTLIFSASNVTLVHTASELGRPVIDASAYSNSKELFEAKSKTSIKLKGLEIKGAGNNDNHLFDINSVDGAGLEIEDCFIYQFVSLADGTFNGGSSTPVKLIQSSFMFTGGTVDAIKFNNNSHAQIENCFFSRSYGNTAYSILKSFGGPNLNTTASFCTFRYRGAVRNQTNAIEGFGKAINCVVVGDSGDEDNNLQGIDAASHTFNIVNVGGVAFQNGGGTSASLGTGESEAAVTFVNGSAIGNTETVIGSYALAEGSRGIDEGVAFNSIAVDINGTVRPQGAGFDMGAFEALAPYWQESDNDETHDLKFGPNGFEIRGTRNKLKTQRFPRASANRQAPYFITIPGPANIRLREKPYKSET